MSRALEVACSILQRGWDRLYSTEEFVFALMPLRHSPTIERLNDVLVRVDRWGRFGCLCRWLRLKK